MKKTAKFIFTGIFYFLLASSCNAQSSAQSIIDKFFSDYEKSGPKESVENVYKTNPWMTKISDDIITVKNKFAAYDEELVGKYFGYVFVDKVETSDCFAIYTYLMKFDRQPLRITFMFYKPDTKWRLFAFQFDDSFDDDFEKALIWKYSIK